MPGSLALLFDIDLSGGHANNFLVQNVSWALVEKLVVKFAATTLQNTVGYDIYKTFEDLFLSEDARNNMILDGIQSEDLCKIRSNAGDKKTSCVDTENKLNGVYRKNYRICLDHQILTNHGVFYPQALYNDLIFELTLAAAHQVVKGSDASKLIDKLINIQLEYEMIRSKTLADKATSAYLSRKEFAYDHVMREEVASFAKGTDAKLNIRINPQRRSLKAILLLFIEPYLAGSRDTEKYINPDITKGNVTINGSPNRVYNTGIYAKDMWAEIERFFGGKHKNKNDGSWSRPNMDLTKFIAGNKFGLLIDLRSMADATLHGNGTRLVNTKDGVHLEIERTTSGSENIHCHIYTISDSQMNIMDRQLQAVQY